MFQLDSSTLRKELASQEGRFKGQVLVSNNGADGFYSSMLTIDDTGSLVSNDTTKLVTSLHSCQLQILEDAFVVKTYNGLMTTLIRCPDTTTFVQLLAALLFWQSLKPRGVINKRLTIPYSFDKSLKPENVLVASCKCFGPLSKHSGKIDVKPGPEVPIFPGPHEQWFSAMAVLKSNGELELINENDGKTLYVLDLTLLLRDEVRELHNSIFESSNYLYVGILDDLRKRMVGPCEYQSEQVKTIFKDSVRGRRIIMEFPFKIDVEDWLVALKSFTTRQAVGLSQQHTLRVSRKLEFNILEVDLEKEWRTGAKLYCEVQMWGAPWFRTAIVDSDTCAFYREVLELDLPMPTRKFRVVMKEASANHYQQSDVVLGSSLVGFEKYDENLQRVPLSAPDGSLIGQMCFSVKVSTDYVLPPDNFNHFEQMILNCDLKELLLYIRSKSLQENLQSTSVLLLDIFQSLQKEGEFFSTLIDQEISKIMGSTDKNIYNTLFRGNSLLTKSVEMFNLRVGQEYLEKVVGKFIISILAMNECTEIDPMRLKCPDDEKAAIIDKNFKVLLGYTEQIWSLIYTTSNDLPATIKQQMTLLRKKIEMYTSDIDITLNCITGFIFLRFFCPVILNPKLFFLTSNHQTGDPKRTLTLISKILLTFSNRTKFGAKEPYLAKFNEAFIDKHKAELLEYLDKTTGKKMDFTERRVKLSSSLERPDIMFIPKDILKELPTVPFLIDKYLRIAQLSDLLAKHPPRVEIDEFGYFENNTSGNGVDKVSNRKSLYKIGSLEFEKLMPKHDECVPNEDFEFGSEEFIKTLLKTSDSDQVFNYMNAGSSLKDLVRESDRLSNKRARLCSKLSDSESPNDIKDMAKYAEYVLSTAIINSSGKIKRASPGMTGLKYFRQDAALNLKLSFKNQDASESLSNDAKTSRDTVNSSPKKKISRLIKSASINTLSSFSTTEEKRKSRTFGSWFKKRL